jgi:hypothetical protein
MKPTLFLTGCIVSLSVFIIWLGAGKSYDSHVVTFSFAKHADWDLHLSWAEATRKTIIEYHQTPLWNPYRCGGAPLLGEPESDIISLYLPLLLLFGPAYGYGMALFAYLIIGLVGFYLLARFYNISRFGSALTASAYLLSGIILLPFAKGAPNFLAAAYLPFVLLSLMKFVQTRQHIQAILCGAGMALMFLSGFHYIGIVILMVVVVCVVSGYRDKQARSMFSCLYPLVFFLGFSALKLFPAIESLLTRSVVDRGYYFSGFGLVRLLYSLIWPIQTPEEFDAWGRDVSGFVGGVSYGLRENGMYIGIALLVLGIVGIIQKSKVRKDLGLVFIIFLWISFGNNIAPSLYGLLRLVPGLDFLEVAQRFRYVWMIPLVLWIGLGWDRVEKFIVAKTKKQFVWPIFFLVVHMLWVNVQIFSHGFYKNQESTQKASSFSQRCFAGSAPPQLQEYPRVSEGYGVAECTENVLIKNYTTCLESSQYKGEIYAESGGQIKKPIITPNRIVFEAEMPKESLVIINQNYDRGWWAKIDGIFVTPLNTRGLLSISVPSGASTIEVFYLPLSFVVGLGLTVLTCLMAARFLIWKNQG